MHNKVSSDWLPSYIKTTQPILEIFKMAGYFPDSPCTYITCHVVPGLEVQEISVSMIVASIPGRTVLLSLLLLLLTAIELLLGGSSPYTSTDETNKNKYT
jgi:hypothetical protein